MNPSLLILVDGRFPAGGHTNSAGVEAAVRIGDVRDEATLERYLVGRLATTGVVDAAFAAHVAGLVDPSDAQLATIDAEYDARVPSVTLRRTSRRFGRQLLRTGRRIWSSPTIDAVARLTEGPHQPVALGALVAASGAGPSDAALVSIHHLSAAVTSAAIRLLGLDPMSVTEIQARVGTIASAWISTAADWAQCAPHELPAHGGSLTDILAADHGRWDARLFVA